MKNTAVVLVFPLGFSARSSMYELFFKQEEIKYSTLKLFNLNYVFKVISLKTCIASKPFSVGHLSLTGHLCSGTSEHAYLVFSHNHTKPDVDRVKMLCMVQYTVFWLCVVFLFLWTTHVKS